MGGSHERFYGVPGGTDLQKESMKGSARSGHFRRREITKQRKRRRHPGV